MPPVEVKTLDDFKKFIDAFSIKAVYCLFEPNSQGNPPIGMRLYFYHEGDIYFLVDYASGAALKMTGIPLKSYGGVREPYVSEDDIKEFVRREFGNMTVNFDFAI